MTTTIYTASCTSSRKARAWLTKYGIPFVERNINKKQLTIEEIKAILSMTEAGTEVIVTMKSKSISELQLDLDRFSLQELIELIHEYTHLRRRPIIMDEQRLLVGFQADDIRQFLPSKLRKNQ